MQNTKYYLTVNNKISLQQSRSRWPRGLTRRSAASRRLRLLVRIPLRAWMSVCCECCVLSGRGLCDELFTRPEESYRLWCVVVCDLDTSWLRRPWPTGGCRAKNKTFQRMKFCILLSKSLHPSTDAQLNCLNINFNVNFKIVFKTIQLCISS
jgi:hypothetical protein